MSYISSALFLFVFDGCCDGGTIPFEACHDGGTAVPFDACHNRGTAYFDACHNTGTIYFDACYDRGTAVPFDACYDRNTEHFDACRDRSIVPFLEQMLDWRGFSTEELLYPENINTSPGIP